LKRQKKEEAARAVVRLGTLAKVEPVVPEGGKGGKKKRVFIVGTASRLMKSHCRSFRIGPPHTWTRFSERGVP